MNSTKKVDIPSHRDISKYAENEILNMEENVAFVIDEEAEDNLIKGIKMDPKKFARHHVQRWIIAQLEKYNEAFTEEVVLPPTGSKLKIQFVGGGDTSRVKWAGCADSTAPQNKSMTDQVFIYDMLMNKVESENGGFIWKEEDANNPDATRLMCIIRGNEKDPLPTKIFKEIDEAQLALSETSYEESFEFEDKEYEYEIELSFVVRTDASYSQYLMGQYHGCLTCMTNPKEFENKTRIENANWGEARTVAINREIFENNPKDSRGHLRTRTGDWDRRHRVTQEPVSRLEIFHFTLLHKNSQCLTNAAKILEHLLLDPPLLQWDESEQIKRKVFLVSQLLSYSINHSVCLFVCF